MGYSKQQPNGDKSSPGIVYVTKIKIMKKTEEKKSKKLPKVEETTKVEEVEQKPPAPPAPAVWSFKGAGKEVRVTIPAEEMHKVGLMLAEIFTEGGIQYTLNSNIEQ